MLIFCVAFCNAKKIGYELNQLSAAVFANAV